MKNYQTKAVFAALGYFAIVFFILVGALLSTCKAQENKSITTMIATDAEVVEFSFINGASFEIKEISGSRFMVEKQIGIDTNINYQTAEFIRESDRYDFKKIEQNRKLLVTMDQKKFDQVTMIKGKQLKEQMHFVIYYPKHSNALLIVNGEMYIDVQ